MVKNKLAKFILAGSILLGVGCEMQSETSSLKGVEVDNYIITSQDSEFIYGKSLTQDAGLVLDKEENVKEGDKVRVWMNYDHDEIIKVKKLSK